MKIIHKTKIGKILIMILCIIIFPCFIMMSLDAVLGLYSIGYNFEAIAISIALTIFFVAYLMAIWLFLIEPEQ